LTQVICIILIVMYANSDVLDTSNGSELAVDAKLSHDHTGTIHMSLPLFGITTLPSL